jgi:hypothetical protein
MQEQRPLEKAKRHQKEIDPRTMPKSVNVMSCDRMTVYLSPPVHAAVAHACIRTSRLVLHTVDVEDRCS